MKVLTTLAFQFLALAVFLALGDVQNSLKVVKCHCPYYYAKEVSNVSCWSKSINRTSSVANIRFYVPKPKSKVFVNFIMYKKSIVNYRPFILNFTEDLCDYFRTNRAGVAWRITFSMFGPYSNLNHTCPYSGEIMVKDLNVDPHMLPSTWPAGEYRYDGHVFDSGIRLITMQFYFDIKEVSKRT